MRPPLCRKKNEAPDQCVLLPKHNDECATVRSAVLCAIGLFSHMTVPSYLAGALSRVMRGVSPDNDKERVTVRSAVPCIPCPPAQSSRSQWPACPGRPRLAASQPEAGGTRLQHRKERHQPLAEWQQERKERQCLSERTVPHFPPQLPARTPLLVEGVPRDLLQPLLCARGD